MGIIGRMGLMGRISLMGLMGRMGLMGLMEVINGRKGPGVSRKKRQAAPLMGRAYLNERATSRSG